MCDKKIKVFYLSAVNLKVMIRTPLRNWYPKTGQILTHPVFTRPCWWTIFKYICLQFWVVSQFIRSSSGTQQPRSQHLCSSGHTCPWAQRSFFPSYLKLVFPLIQVIESGGKNDKTAKWGALSFWNDMLWISEIMCFEFIELCAMKRGFPKMSCFQFLEL